MSERSRARRRGVHFVFAACLGAYLYAPLASVPAVELLVRVVVFPGLALTGLLLWRGPVVRQWVGWARTGGEH